MEEITAKAAWEQLEKDTDGQPRAMDVLGYIAENAEGWVANFARMAYLVAIAENW